MNKREIINVADVVDVLIGNVEAIGESRYDEQSNENLKQLGELYLHIQSKLIDCSRQTSRYEASMNQCGKIAVDYLRTDFEYLKQAIEEAQANDFYKKPKGE